MTSLSSAKIETEKLMLMDYYSLFPNELKKIRLPSGNNSHKQTFKAVKEPYENIANPKRLIFELRGIQGNAIKYLIANEMLQMDELKKNVSLNYDKLKSLPNDIDLANKENWFVSMIEVFESIDLKGNNGLKARTGLMEYRYDV